MRESTRPENWISAYYYYYWWASNQIYNRPQNIDNPKLQDEKEILKVSTQNLEINFDDIYGHVQSLKFMTMQSQLNDEKAEGCLGSLTLE